MTSPKASRIQSAIFYTLAFLVRSFYLLYFYMLRVEIVNPRWGRGLGRDSNVIYACWHSKTFLLIPFGRGCSVAILTLLDTRNVFLDHLAKLLGYKTVPVTSESRAAIRLKRCLEDDKMHVLLAVDGPGGPRGSVRPGVGFLSEKTGKPIIAVQVEHQNSFRLKKRWDQFEIPYPFTKSRVTFSEPIYFNSIESSKAESILKANLGAC